MANMKINIDLIYPIGSIYLTVNNTDPNVVFGGTWQQITSDAYLKIVSSNGGSLGGTSSDHKIPLSSIPSHTHKNAIRYSTSGNLSGSLAYFCATTQYGPTDNYNVVMSAGGGQAYYPYYLGIYVWKRIS